MRLPCLIVARVGSSPVAREANRARLGEDPLSSPAGVLHESETRLPPSGHLSRVSLAHAARESKAAGAVRPTGLADLPPSGFRSEAVEFPYSVEIEVRADNPLAARFQGVRSMKCITRSKTRLCHEALRAINNSRIGAGDFHA